MCSRRILFSWKDLSQVHIRGVLLTDNDSYDEHSEQMHAYEKSVTKNPIDQFQIQDTANCARLPFVREILQPSRV